MQLCLLLPPRPDYRWTLALQAGVRYAVTKAAPQLSGLPAPHDLEALRTVHRRFADAGLTLIGLEGDQFDMQPIKWGTASRDEALALYRRMLENMAELGLRLLCYNFMLRPPDGANDWHRTSEVAIRGGALTTRFAEHELPEAARQRPLLLAHDALWANYEYFIRAVAPTAQRCGVRMGLHPDDPPVPVLGGVPRIFGNIDAFTRALALHAAPTHGVTFCQANFALMPGDLASHARRLRDRIAFVHLRDVQGVANDFTEAFHDAGPTDMAAMLRLYHHELGLDVPLRDDHVPTLHGDANVEPGYGGYGHLLAIGYLKGLMDAAGVPRER